MTAAFQEVVCCRREAPAISASTSIRVNLRSPTLAMPVTKPASTVLFIAGAGLIIQSEFEQAGDRIDQRTDHPSVHDDHGEAAVFDRPAVELDAPIGHRRDHAAQVHHAFDEAGALAMRVHIAQERISCMRWHVDALCLRTRAKAQEFGGAVRRTSAGRAILAGPLAALHLHVHGVILSSSYPCSGTIDHGNPN